MTARDLVTQLNTIDEHNRLEAKRGSDIGKSILETVCSFANEPGLGGGDILLGVERDEDTLFPMYRVVGVPDPDKAQQDLASQCRTMFNVPVSITADVEEVDGKRVVVAHVNEAPAAAKPIYFKATGLPKGAYRRIGSTDVRCTEEDIAALYQGRRTETFDGMAVEGTGIADVDADAIAVYRRERARISPTAEELQYDDADLLMALGCAKTDGEKVLLTTAGLVLFGRRLSLRRLMPMVRVDYIRVPGREWVPSSEARYEASIELRGPLMLLINRAQAAILDDIPRAFNLPEGSLQRTDVPMLPLRVVREALVNALMHRSYREQQPMQIIRYANRLEMRNPGFSLKAEEQLGEPGSEPRNPFIAAVLHDLNFAETKGTGIRTMRTEMERAGLTPPSFESDREANRFIATFLFHHFLTEGDIRWLGQFRDLELSDDNRKALVYLRETGSIDNRTYRDLTKIHAADATQALRHLRELGLIEARDRTSARYYVPAGRLREALPVLPAATDLPGRVAGQEPSFADKFSAIEDKLRAIDDRAKSFEDRQAHSIAASTLGAQPPDGGSTAEGDGLEALRAALPASLQLMLEALGRRTDPERVQTAIEALCGWRTLSVRQLSGLLGRSVRYTWDLVQELERQKRLVPRFPNAARHPQQAYTATQAAP